MPNSDSNDRDDRGAQLGKMCDRCLTAFEADHEACPGCGRDRPDDGWKSTRHFPDAWLGRRLDGRYVLRQRLGRGTTSSVYRADSPHVDATYAVKVIDLRNDEGEGPSLRDRVEREVRILSSLSTPHVVDFHDFIELPEGILAVVMDHADGRTLRDVLHDEGALEMDRALELARDVAAGLRGAHRGGVVHRDLKPDNVMLREVPGAGEIAQVLDFGIARIDHDVSETVGFIGTPRYASPEQVHGEDLDRRSDIYNLGMVLYHMVAGRPPFTQSSVNELLAAQSREEPPPLAEVASRNDPPEGLESVIESMLAKEPGERPDDLGEVLDRLDDVQSTLDADHSEGSASAPEFAPPETAPEHGLGDAPSTGNFGTVSADEEVDSDFADREPPPSDVFDVIDEQKLVFRDDDNKLRVRDRTDDRNDVLVTPSHPVTALSADGERIVVGQEDGSVAVVDERDVGLSRLHRETDAGAVSAVAQSRDGTRFVAGYESGAVVYGELDSEWEPLPDGPRVASVAIHDDGACVAVSRGDRKTQIWMLPRESDGATTLLEHDRVPESISFSPDGYLLAVDFLQGEVELFSAPTGRRVGTTSHSRLRSSSVFDEAEES